MISASNLSFHYPSGKGIADIDFQVPAGTAAGYLGPNGAGKSTTIRTLLGFLSPQKGRCTINGMDCFHDAAKIKHILGYMPGEIAFPKGLTCMEFLNYQCALRGIKSPAKMKELLARFELNPKGSIKSFSKGMKQKVGIIAAFMHDPEILILDEPTGGLDPLMQNVFISLLLEEKKKGKTILLSSHIFEEIERTCDTVLIIRDGRLVANADTKTITATKRKVYLVQTDDPEQLSNLGLSLGSRTEDGTEVYIKGDEVDAFLKKIATIHVTGLSLKAQNLEEVFLHFYQGEGDIHA